jgi:hypothetical protein
MSQIEQDRYWPVARDKPGFLIAMMKHLAGNSHISFEGDLSKCKFGSELSPSLEEMSALQRATAYPRQDFVVLPLRTDTIRPILDVVLPEHRFMKEVIHIQIEKDGRLEFGAYDNFHPECIVCFLGVSVDLLNSLKAKRIIRSWTMPFEGATRWHG